MVAGNDERLEKWEKITDYHTMERGLNRLKVDGGYLYREIICQNGSSSVALCLVPDVDLSRYKSHLRDAYRQGYNDGQSDAKVGCRADLEL